MVKNPQQEMLDRGGRALHRTGFAQRRNKEIQDEPLKFAEPEKRPRGTELLLYPRGTKYKDARGQWRSRNTNRKVKPPRHDDRNLKKAKAKRGRKPHGRER